MSSSKGEEKQNDYSNAKQFESKAIHFRSRGGGQGTHVSNCWFDRAPRATKMVLNSCAREEERAQKRRKSARRVWPSASRRTSRGRSSRPGGPRRIKDHRRHQIFSKFHQSVQKLTKFSKFSKFTKVYQGFPRNWKGRRAAAPERLRESTTPGTRISF